MINHDAPLLIDNINTFWWSKLKLTATDAWIHFDTTKLNRFSKSKLFNIGN